MDDFQKLKQVQQLVVDITKINRNHFVVGTNDHENVVEHSFSLLMLCWKIFEIVKPPLDISKIFKYALVHDFTERGLVKDTNTYAKEDEKELKKEREELELEKISTEFNDFPDMVHFLKNYEYFDEEALFVWSVDKMQGMITGDMDNWRPYANYGVTFEEFCNKSDYFMSKCSPYLKNILKEVFEENKKTYYDNLEVKSKKL